MIETLKQIDTEWFFAINQHARNGLFDLLCPFIRTQSNWYLAYAVIIYVMFNQYGKRAWWLLLAIAITIITSDQLSGNLIKNLVQRLRPCNDPIIGQQVHLLVNCGKGFSFVSAHATNHFAVAFLLGGIFGRTYKWVWPLAILWAASIGFSQIYVGVHYPMDVICGSLLGSTVGMIGLKVIRTKILNESTPLSQ